MFESDLNLWDQLVVLLAGKKIGVLGQREAGKTTLHNHLRGMRIESAYTPTVVSKPVPARRPAIETALGHVRKLALRRSRDVPGNLSGSADAWRELVKESDVLLYVFNAAHVVDGNAARLASIVDDCGFICKTLKDRKLGEQPELVVLVGNRADEIDGWNPGLSGRRLTDVYDSVAFSPAISQARNLIGSSLIKAPDVVLGSLLKAPDELVSEAFAPLFG